MKKKMLSCPHLGQIDQLFLLKYCTARDNDPTWLKTDFQIYKVKTIIYKKPQSFYWNHWSWNENTMSVCFRHVSYSAESHPLPLGPKGQSVPNSLRSFFLSFCKLAKRGEKKTLSIWLCEKRLWWKFSHVFLSLHKFSVLRSSRGVGIWAEMLWFYIGLVIQTRLPTFIWL